MTPATLIHRLGRLLSGVVLVASGSYVFVYLVRWEWNRALIAGLFFLAAELFLVADVVLGRIAALGRQSAVERDQDRAQLLAARLRESRPPRPGPFAWLGHDPDRLNVLLPILIGAGVVLSALSYLVEQVSRVSALPVAEDELARGLSTLALPAEGLRPLGRPPAPQPAPVLPEPGRAVSTWLTLVGFVALVVGVVTAGLMLLLSVPAPADPGRATQVELLVLRRNVDQPERDVVLALWAACRVRIPQDVDLVELARDPGDPARMRMVLSPAPGETDTREFVGCLQDAVIERVRTDVLAVGPASPPAPGR